LAGLAKDYKLMGDADKANEALDRLRRVNPNDPNIAKIEALSQLENAERPASPGRRTGQAGQADEAMRIYRQLYGDRPPDGDIAHGLLPDPVRHLHGKAAAIAGMRSLAERNPGDSRLPSRWASCSPTTPKPAPKAFAFSKRILRIRCPGRPASGAHLGFGQPRFRCGAAPVPQAHPQDKEVASQSERPTKPSWRR
jgi:tetratricopeptide (TPR) repeat protein